MGSPLLKSQELRVGEGHFLKGNSESGEGGWFVAQKRRCRCRTGKTCNQPTHFIQSPTCKAGPLAGVSLILLTTPIVSLILFVMPIVLLFTLHCLLSPGETRHELRGWKKAQRAVGTTDAFILSWLAQQP